MMSWAGWLASSLALASDAVLSPQAASQGLLAGWLAGWLGTCFFLVASLLI